ncbi:MAG: hypothetical protein B6I22_14570 [Desulfobacteraceae bacterium 4572_123]|nr:MAG: hypothetical protein B6I22_14570 [Desulfobacteraceae bacterium 4572_123]
MKSFDQFDFDTVVNRKGTNSYKWDNAEVLNENLLPLSVADMDFAVSSEITQALVNRTSTPVYGYEFQPDALKEAIVAWHSKRHGFEVHKNGLLFTPGVMNGLAISLLALTQKGDRIVIQPPVYPPFFSVVKENKRQLLLNPLHYDSGSLRYTMDFDSLEKLFSEQKPRLMFLCNPHNPVGRVWTREELHRLGELCEKYQVILVSDDIHADLVFPGHRYQPLISISETLRNNAIQMMSPGKSFNIPGMRFSYALIANRDLRERFSEKLSALALTKTNIMAAVASQAAYQNGAQWLDRVLEYIWHNHVLLKTTLSSELAWAKVIPLEGTFLAWVDLNASGLNHNQLSRVVRSRAKLMLFEGSAFGDAGHGFMRINLACPRKTLQEAIKRLVDAFVQVKENPLEPIKILDNPSTACNCCS